MESSSSKAEVIKPVLLKAGIPLVISVAGFIYASILAKRRVNPEASSIENPVSSLETDSQEKLRDEGSLDSTSSSICGEDDEKIVASTHYMNMIRSSEIQDRTAYEEEILGLRTRIEELQKKELELEMKFLRFCDLKEQESVLMELKHMLLIETLYIEFMDREILSMETETERFNIIVMEYLRVVEQLENGKSQNGLLQRKVKRLLAKTKGQAKIIREKDLMIKAKDAEIKRNVELLQERSNVIQKLEDEVRELKSVTDQLQKQKDEELKSVTDQLQKQKDELSKKLEMAENSLSSISKADQEDVITMEEYKQLADEYEQVQTDRAAELKELIYLRWCNACLRYELKRYQLLQEYMQENKHHIEEEFEGVGFRIEEQLDGAVALMEQGQASLGVTATNGGEVCSKRKKLIKKFKKWVDGSEKMKSKLDGKEKHESKCFGRHSVSDEVQGEYDFVHARKSCSSV